MRAAGSLADPMHVISPYARPYHQIFYDGNQVIKQIFEGAKGDNRLKWQDKEEEKENLDANSFCLRIWLD